MANLKKIVALILVVSTVFAFTGCLKYTGNILEFTVQNPDNSGVDTANTTGVQQPVTQIPTTTVPGEAVSSVLQESTTAALVTEAPSSMAPVTEAPVSQTPATEAPVTQAPAADPTTFSKAQLIAYLTTAVNTTKAYTGNVKVHHTENITVNIKECTGGSVVMNIVQPIVDKLTAPNDETLNFSGGKATNSEGETVPLLLPKRQNFSLTDAAVKSITATKSGTNTIVTLVLNSETATKDTIPPFHAGAAGYLDIGNIDLPSIVKIKEFTATYPATKTVYTINDKGYVVKADYNISMQIQGSGSAGISANVTAEGSEVEVWEIQW